jgi:Arc/MetJ-type ribon-helix-helix transcriptional regulator
MTIERKIRIQEKQAEFIENYAEYGFHDSDEMIRRALELLEHELELVKELELSADLYAEMYESDEETREWFAANNMQSAQLI